MNKDSQLKPDPPPSADSGSRRVLLVDDTEENLHVASFLLRSNGYRVSTAHDGFEALTACERDRPDLILLDVMMPGMDGYECCRRLKAREDLKDIPVIFLSAMADSDDVVAGLELGAVDHVGKPFNAAELLARVATHVRLRRLQVTVEENYRALSELEAMRDNLVNMIIHDLRTPLSVVQGNLDLVENFASKITGFEQFATPLRDANQATVDLIHMVSNLLDISRMEDGKMPLNRRDNDIAELIDQTRRLMSVKAAQNDIALRVEAGSARVSCDAELIQRVLVNLTANAIKFSFPDTSVRLTTRLSGDHLTVNVIDSGPGIPPDYQAKVFEKFGQVDAYQDRKKFSTGLGLTFCKLAVEAHGGRIGLESDGRSGSRFWFTLPAHADN